MSIIPYQSKSYQDKKEFLILINHGNYNQGPINVLRVISIIEFINQQMPQNIRFEVSKIAQELQGGACSALGLKFCKYALQLMQGLAEEVVWKKLSDYVSDLETFRSQKKSKDFRLTIRNIQAAFNTIVVLNRDDKNVHAQKIQALSIYFGLSAQRVTDEVDITSGFCEQIVSRQMDSLTRGIYVIRILKPPETPNDKVEEYGHTLPLVKLGIGWLFLDVNLGLFNADAKLIFDVLNSAYQRWPCSHYTIYKMESTSKKGFEEA